MSDKTDETDDLYAALNAYWNAQTPQEERDTYQRLLKLGMPDQYAPYDIKPVLDINKLAESIAEDYVIRNGFGWYTDPSECGQDAYDICANALDEARHAVRIMQEYLNKVDKVKV